MEDITFLEDYQYQLKLNELDRNLMEMERLGMEVANGLMAIHNATVVEQYQDKYGYTEHFQMLIGEEGLFDSAKDALRGIIGWLKKKLVQLASIIFLVVKSIVDVITSLVWVVVNISKMNATKSPYSLMVLESVFRLTYDKVTNNSSFGKNVQHVTTIGELTSALNEYLSGIYTELEQGIDNAHKERVYARVEFSQAAQKFEYILNNNYVTMMNTLGKVIDNLQKSLNENDDLTRTREKIQDFAKRFPGAQALITETTKSQIYEHVRVTDEGGMLAAFRIQASACIAFATSYSQFYSKCVRRGVSILKELHAAYNKGEVSIHMEFPFDQAMIKRLSDFYGAPIKVTKLIVTNMSPTTWNIATETPGLMGWCYPGNGSGVSFPTELWVNARVVTSWIARFYTASVNDARVNKYDHFLGVVVHECKHLWDMQYGKEFDVVREGDSFFKYRKYQHERRAQEAATKFEITDRDRAWAKKIIDQVEAEIKKQKSK
mgnify:FL=1